MIQDKVINNVGIIKVRGTLMGGEETTEVHTKVKRLVTDGVHKIILDLAGVKWMNSHGMGMLMACYSSVQNVDGKIGLSRVSEKVNNLMNITKVNTLFENFESIKQGVKSFRKNWD